MAAAAFFALGTVFQFGAGPAVEGLRDWAEAHYLDLLNPLRPRMGLAVLGMPVVALLLAATAHGRLSRGQLELALIMATAAVLVPLAAILNPPLQPAVAGKPPETVRFLLEQGASGRVFSHRAGTVYYVHTRRYGPGTEAGFADDLGYRFKAEMLAPGLNLRWGMASADGYEQLHSRYQETLLRYMGSERTSSWAGMWGVWDRITMRERARVLRMLGVRYVLSGMELTTEAPELRPVKQTMVESGPASQAPLGVLVLENPNPLPRYYLVATSREFARDADALDAVALGEVDPGATVLLPAGAAAQAAGEPSMGGDGPGGEGSVGVLSLRNSEVDLRVSIERPAYLVTSDSYWPGWRAFVDGREVSVLRANVGGRAVSLGEGGAHRVAFRFEPPGFAAGLGLSVAAGLLGVVWLLLGLRRPSGPGHP